jgi:DNA-binding response OmpR family regulator
MRQHSIVNPNQAVYADQHLLLDFVGESVTLDGNIVYLTRQEYLLLAHLVQHAGEILPRDALLRDVWGYSPKMQTRTLDVHVRRLRKKLGHYAERGIETVFGVGYRFQPRHDASGPNFSVDPESPTRSPTG